MQEAISKTSSLKKALEMLGMAAKGGNYIRIKRIAVEMVSHVGLEPTEVAV